MPLQRAPWGDHLSFEWDEHNIEEMWKHGVRHFEVEQCFRNEHVIRPHRKARSEPEKYGDRYVVQGITDGGRKLVIIVQHTGDENVRPITAWDL